MQLQVHSTGAFEATSTFAFAIEQKELVHVERALAVAVSVAQEQQLEAE
jgi:hypothetical protein